MTLKQKILAATKTIQKISVPELGTEIFIRRMNGTELNAFETAQFKAKEEAKTKGDVAYLPLSAVVLSMTMCDEAGELLFKPEEINTLDSVVIDRLATAALNLNGLTKESRAEIEKKVSDLIGSGTTSPIN